MAYIYKISCKDLNVKECYFGSTINFHKRKNKHNYNCYNENKKQYNCPVYCFIRNNGGWDNWEINIIDSITTIDKKIYEKCEAKYIRDNIDIVLNNNIPDRTLNEWKEDNKEKLSEYYKDRYQDNKEKKREYNIDYYQNNKEKINEKRKEYYENNKDKIKEKVICDHCGCKCKKNNLKRHQKTKKCINFKNI